ncbi:MAG TPA: hypothetical protein VFS51_04050 [Gemmatimonadales bacterium]|nr:hypothetical protein [Gemmatimonadales bacterium]
MQRLTDALQILRDRVVDLATRLIAHLPEILAALLITLAGLLIGRWLRRLTMGLGERIYRRLDRSDRSPGLEAAGRSSIILRLIGNLVMWSTVVVFATVALDVAGLDPVVTWLGRVVQYLPTLLVGLFIIIAGYLLSGIVREFVQDALASARVPQSAVLGRLAQFVTIVGAIVIGIDQMGVKVTLITTVVSIVLGGFLAGLSLAFGLGARSLVANLVGAHHVRRYLRPGERARIGEMAGEVIEFTPTGIVLASEAGRVHVPASRFHDEPLIVSPPEEPRG